MKISHVAKVRSSLFFNISFASSLCNFNGIPVNLDNRHTPTEIYQGSFDHNVINLLSPSRPFGCLLTHHNLQLIQPGGGGVGACLSVVVTTGD